ncbi:tRNA-specific 2-thiouridylase MnmA [Gemmata sp. SH-PL17]|uniref:tRNA 2-thiouridine(34) synthase MnmA n=1 Tax=Gemmata sp. SH-PL17 TaxID=1630693 RepID=UPI00078BBC1C|nr:tRNA 2-thiouridine(34) synthase MnmA [Gemmata sp. SH-PL17]AMV22965.1 tRNA-specific 2-thiouridylase MnmA [Gemmata sp. SH-PL17]
MPRVVLAMSGGVDSSASAVLLKRQGFDVIGLFMRTGTHGHDQGNTRADHKKGCCSAIDAGDARRVADKLDIPFYALDFEAEFNRIIDYFVDEYARGRTPNPCVVCNNWLKFGQLWAFGQKLGADYIATGHYAQVIDGELHKGIDGDKDQSYVLHGIKRDVLPHLLFPVGGYTKPQIRAFAREAGLLSVAEKPDSVEICFVPSGDHTDVVRSRRPEVATAGLITERNGTVLGPHDGLDRFTIGQRKGLNIGGGKKRFVLELLPETNTVVVGDENDLLASGLIASEMNWLIDAPVEPTTCTAKIRYRHTGVPATVTALPNGGAGVNFDTPQPAVTPGQAVAFYDGTRVLGGGWVEKALR